MPDQDPTGWHDPGQLTGPRERLNYFKYQFLVADDLRFEQEYHRRSLYDLNAATQTPGVVSGLTLNPSAQTGSVDITGGLAIDKLGRPLILDGTTTLGLEDHPANTPVYVMLRYAEKLDGERTLLQAEGGGVQYQHSLEQAQVWSDVTIDGGSIVLGRATLGTNNTVSCDEAGRQRSSAVGPIHLDPATPPPDPASADLAYLSFWEESGTRTTRLRLAVGNGAEDRLSLYQDGADRLTVYNGNVGIGTDSPTARLHVSGGNLAVDGNVGIGTESPGSPLDVHGRLQLSAGSDVQALVFADQNGAIYPDGWIGAATTVGDGRRWLHVGGITDPADGQRRLALFANKTYLQGPVGIANSDPKAALHVSGNVAIGGSVGIATASPGSPLDVRGRVQISAGSDAQALVFADKNGAIYPDGWIGAATNVGDGRRWLHVGGITDPADGQRRLALFANKTYLQGPVGIGTTDPKAALHVSGGVQISGVPKDTVTPGWVPALTFPDYPQAGIGFLDPYSVDLQKWLMIEGAVDSKNVSIHRLMLYADPAFVTGKLGVNTNNPRGQLDVHGNVQISAGSDIGALVFADIQGNVYPDGWIGAATNVGDGRRWLHVGGITDPQDTAKHRRLALFADYTYISGRLGIGTTTPQATLDVNGDIRVSGNQNLVKVFTKTVAIKNDDRYGKGSASVDYTSANFANVWAVIPIVTGFSIADLRNAAVISEGALPGLVPGQWINNVPFDATNSDTYWRYWHGDAPSGFPQVVWAHVADVPPFSRTSATIEAYCSENIAANEHDNWTIVTVLVIGQGA